MLCPSDPIDVTGSGVLDMATGQPRGAWACSGSQESSWAVYLHVISGSEILEAEKNSVPSSPQGCVGNELILMLRGIGGPAFPALNPASEPCILKDDDEQEKRTDRRKKVTGNACRRTAVCPLAPPQKIRIRRKEKRSHPRVNGSK